MKKTTALLTQLLTQLRRAEDTKTLDKIPRSYGLLPNTVANSDSNYSYDMLLYPSLMEVDKIYQYSRRPLAAPEVTLLPLVNFTDYYEFIHEKLLPEYGYANIGENSIFLKKGVGRQQIVVVEKGQIIACGHPDRRVGVACNALVFLKTLVTDSLIIRLVLLHHLFHGNILPASVGDTELQIWVSLIQH